MGCGQIRGAAGKQSEPGLGAERVKGKGEESEER